MAKQSKKNNIFRILLGLIVSSLILLILVVSIFTVSNAIIFSKNISSIEESLSEINYTDKLTPVLDDEGYWTFTTDRDFRIMQLTDIHIGGGLISNKYDQNALNAITAMIIYEKPDLVIATGDLVYPVPFTSGTLNNKNSFKQISTVFEKLGVYWTFAFGNHDTESYSYYDRESFVEIYEKENLKYCLFQRGPDDVYGYGNDVIYIKNSLGFITQSIITMDSNAYKKADPFGIIKKYDNLRQSQVDWYENEIKLANNKNISHIDTLDNAENYEKYRLVKSLLFIHIPLVEYADALNEYAENGNKDTENVKYIYGEQNEKVCCGAGSDEWFETALKLNSTQGVFCGHDHVNNISVEYKGIRLSYNYSIDYIAYTGIHKETAYRGCTIITIKDDFTFESVLEKYSQDKYSKKPIKFK